jgi:hypothetical protein
MRPSFDVAWMREVRRYPRELPSLSLSSSSPLTKASKVKGKGDERGIKGSG